MASTNAASESQKARFLEYIQSAEFHARFGPSPAERERRRLAQSLLEQRLLNALQDDRDAISLTAEEVGRRNVVALLEERLRTGIASSNSQMSGHPALLRILPAALNAITQQVARFASSSLPDLERNWRRYVDIAFSTLMETFYLMEHPAPLLIRHPGALRRTNFADPALADLKGWPVHGRLSQTLFLRFLPRENTVVLVDIVELGIYVPPEGSTPGYFRLQEPRT